MRFRRTLSALAALGLSLAGITIVAAPAAAADIPVTSTADSGAGSLRAAIASAGAGDTIVFNLAPVDDLITLESTITIVEPITIQGPGVSALTITRDDSFDLFVVDLDDAGDFTVNDLAFTGNQENTQGRAINVVDNVTDDVAIARSSFTGFTSADDLSGGAVYVADASGTITVTDSTFSDNVSGADGGAIAVASAAGGFSVDESTFTRNSAAVSGGAIHLEDGINLGGEIRILNSTFTENEADDNYGGAVRIYFGGTGVTITNVVFTDNLADSEGGALQFESLGSSASINYSTFSGNESSVGGAIQNYSGDFDSGESLTIAASSFFDNEAGRGGAINSSSSNDSDDPGAVITQIVDSTFSGNFGSDGAALNLQADDGTVLVLNSTIDETAEEAYAIEAGGEDGTIAVRHSTVVGDGGIGLDVDVDDDDTPVSVAVSHTIVQSISGPTFGITDGENLDGVFAVEWSLLSDTPSTDIVSLGAGNQTETDAKLGPLQDNGGPTLTRAPIDSSTAINHGNPAVAGAPVFDQRQDGFARVVQVVDIGAVEFQSEILAATGLEFNVIIPIVAGILLLGGIAAIVLTSIRRRKAAAQATEDVPTVE